MSDETYAQEVIDAYPRLLVENYCIVASSALLWFDFALTFTTEVRRIWRGKFSGATVVYLFTRYTAIIERIFFLLEALVWHSSDKTCGMINRVDSILTGLSYLAVSAFTILRVYGVWGRDWKPLLFVVPLSLVKPALYLVENAHYVPLQAGPPFGCVYIFPFSDQALAALSAAVKSTTIAADAILIALTWIKTFGISRASSKLKFRTPLATMLLRDGTAYFIILLIIQIITIVSSQIGANLAVWLVWPYFDQTLTVIFLSRFMLDLRGLYFDHADDGQVGDASALSIHGFSDIRFTTSRITAKVVGNLGAPLGTIRSFYSDVPSLSHSNSDDAYLGVHREDGDDRDARRRKSGDEWYEDEKMTFASDPFMEGMKIELALDMQKTAEIAVELHEVGGSPISPESPEGSSAV